MRTFLGALALIAFSAAYSSSQSSKDTCDYSYWTNQGDTLAKSGQCKKAVGAYSRAILCRPTDPWPWYYRSLLRDGLGESALSKRDMDRALKLADKDTTFQNRNKPKDGAVENFQWFYGPSAQCVK